MALDGVGRRPQVLLRHEVGVDVVVGDGAVLVGPGHAVDAEAARRRRGGPSERHSRAVSTSSSRPTSRSKSLVAGGGDVADDGVGDVGVDVEGGGAGRPVAGALLAADRAPRERGALEAEHASPARGPVERGVPPAQRVARPHAARCG